VWLAGWQTETDLLLPFLWASSRLTLDYFWIRFLSRARRCLGGGGDAASAAVLSRSLTFSFLFFFLFSFLFFHSFRRA